MIKETMTKKAKVMAKTRKKKRKLMKMETQLKRRRHHQLLSRKLKVQGALLIKIR
jgi:hypothetical protein